MEIVIERGTGTETERGTEIETGSGREIETGIGMSAEIVAVEIETETMATAEAGMTEEVTVEVMAMNVEMIVVMAETTEIPPGATTALDHLQTKVTTTQIPSLTATEIGIVSGAGNPSGINLEMKTLLMVRVSKITTKRVASPACSANPLLASLETHSPVLVQQLQALLLAAVLRALRAASFLVPLLHFLGT